MESGITRRVSNHVFFAGMGGFSTRLPTKMANQAKIQNIGPMLEDACKRKKRHFYFGMMKV